MSKSDSINLFCLPDEILEYILCDDSLSYLDVISVSCCCHKLNNICCSQEIWRMKINQSFPSLEAVIKSKNQVIDWKGEMQLRLSVGRKVKHCVSKYSYKFYSKQEISQEGFSDISSLMSEGEHYSIYIIDELNKLINDNSSSKNLTEKYYAKKALAYVQHIHLEKEWKSFLMQPSHMQHLETGAILVSQWCQPTKDIWALKIPSQLDAIALKIKDAVVHRVPNHPLAAVKHLHENADELVENAWTGDECRIILEMQNNVLYKEMGFCGNDEGYYEIENSYIDMVLERKKGIPITLSILYTSVARRLGVLCEPVNFPSHFLLRFKQHNDSGIKAYTFIDAFRGGKFLNENDCRQINPRFLHSGWISDEHMESSEPARVFERVVRNLVQIGRQNGAMGGYGITTAFRHSIELYLVLRPDDADMWFLLTRLYIQLNINLHQVIGRLNARQDTDEEMRDMIGYLTERANAQLLWDERLDPESIRLIAAKKRPQSGVVKFSVGLVMKHLRYDYLCVITGWDETCKAGQEWIEQMGVNILPKKDKQPFYNVLVEDGSSRYAAQENLTLEPDPPDIGHEEVGKHFKEFTGTHYVPNDEKLAEYPEDYEVTLNYVEENCDGS